MGFWNWWINIFFPGQPSAWNSLHLLPMTVRLLPKGKKILHLSSWAFCIMYSVWYFCGIFKICCTGKLKLSHKNRLFGYKPSTVGLQCILWIQIFFQLKMACFPFLITSWWLVWFGTIRAWESGCCFQSFAHSVEAAKLFPWLVIFCLFVEFAFETENSFQRENHLRRTS